MVVAKPFDATLTFDAPSETAGGCAREEFVTDALNPTVPEKPWKLVRFSL
jgi:hypothetical protein